MNLFSRRRARWFKRQARRWGPCAAIALALLAASQTLWAWQTWQLRALLAIVTESGP